MPIHMLAHVIDIITTFSNSQPCPLNLKVMLNTIPSLFQLDVKSLYNFSAGYGFSYGQLAFCLFGAVIANLIFDIVYNCYICPLIVIPGPKLSAISSIPISLHRIRGKKFERFVSLHKQYGPVVRVAPQMVLFADKDVVRQILVTDVRIQSQMISRHDMHISRM
jgi:hypothetical protein